MPPIRVLITLLTKSHDPPSSRLLRQAVPADMHALPCCLRAAVRQILVSNIRLDEAKPFLAIPVGDLAVWFGQIGLFNSWFGPLGNAS